ncbi:MAG: calcium-binding protein [Pelagimonas sp.]|uniref:calcium-binding protein n=1 Tax=Pelagimonas sp. TaxID=2073170 RepID=UPI003D6AE8C4
MLLRLEGRLSTGDTTLDTDLSDLDIVTLESGTYLYATTGGQGGLVGYRLQDGQMASEVDRQYFSNGVSGAVSGAVRVTQIDGQMQAVFGGQGGGALLGYSLNTNGTLGGLLRSADLANGTNRISDIVQTSSVATEAVYVADEANGQLTAYMPGSNGTYAPLPGGQVSIGAGAQLETVVVGSVEYLLASDAENNGVDVYRVMSTGGLQQASSMGAEQGLGISTPTALEVVQAFGETWVLLGAAGSHGISLMRMNETGGLEPMDLVLDTLSTRFGGVAALATAQVGDRVLVLAGGADDGLSLFSLLPDGRLVHIQTIEHQTGSGLMNVEAIDMVVIGTEIQVFVTSGLDGGITQFSIPLAALGLTIHNSNAGNNTLNGSGGDDLLISTAGNDTLFGGAGNDILATGIDGGYMHGGAGADRFVVTGGSERVIIADFTSGEDILDLSDLPMLRSTGQLTIVPFSGGARVYHRDQEILLLSSDGATLSAEDIFGPRFDWPDRILILPPEPGLTIVDTSSGNLLEGSERPDTIQGNSGDDTINGGAGNDVIAGGGHNDLLQGEGGHDKLYGGGSHDTLWGGTGRDTLWGGAHDDLMGGGGGADQMRGEDGNDELWGSDGQDTMWGGEGNDSLGGGNDRDTLYGDAGQDLLWGGGGDDWIIGGADGDSLGGYWGNDTLWGGLGDDGIWGGGGDDLGYGEEGNDTYGGLEGHDRFYGGTGNDLGNGNEGNDSLSGEDGHDTLKGEDGFDVLWGGAGNDSMHGGGQNDTLYGGAGNDTLLGAYGADELWAADGDDELRGGEGNDTLGGSDGDDTLWGGEGNDIVWGGSNHDLQYGDAGNDNVGGFYGNDTLFGGNGNDGVWGNVGNDSAEGGAGHDTVGGGRGNDTLRGGTGADQVWGSEGNDFLSGDDGHDTVAGGTGNDTLLGGAGNDTFTFYAQPGNDVIRDFTVGEDQIQILEHNLTYQGLNLEATSAGTVIHLEGGDILLEGVTRASLDADDFLFS